MGSPLYFRFGTMRQKVTSHHPKRTQSSAEKQQAEWFGDGGGWPYCKGSYI